MTNLRFVRSLLGSTIALVCMAGSIGDGALAEEPTPGLVWEARYEYGYSEDFGKAVVTDEAGNIYITGSGVGPMGTEDLVTLKYNSAGEQLWKTYFNYNHFNVECYPNFVQADETAHGIGLDAAGNVYVLGTTSYGYFCPVNHSYSIDNFSVVKYDPDGNQFWAYSLGSEYTRPHMSAMAVDQAGNVYLAGFQQDQIFATYKIPANGSYGWSVLYYPPSGSSGRANDIALDVLGNVYVTGRSFGGGTGYDFTTIRYDPEGNEVWVARYDGPDSLNDEASAIFLNNLGEVFVTGSSEGTGTSSDFATVKYDPDGNEVWMARYNGPADSTDEAVSVVATGLGNVFVTGTSEGLGSGSDLVTVKYGLFGGEQWVARYDGPISGADSAAAVTVSTSGDVVVTGKSEGTDSDTDYITICYRPSSGAESWKARYDGPAHREDTAASLTSDALGNVIVTGSSNGVDTGPDYATIKYGPTGGELWTARVANSGASRTYRLEPAAMALDPWGNIFVTGKLEDGSLYVPDAYVTTKYDPDGSELWSAEHSSLDGDSIVEDLTIDAEGNVLVTGSLETSHQDPEAYVTVKYNPDGSELWVAEYDGAEGEEDAAVSVAVDGIGNVHVTGYSEGDGTGWDYATVKYGPDGGEHWARRYNGPLDSTDFPASIAVDSWSNVYVTGISRGSGTGYDFATVKYDPNGNELWVARYDGPASEDDEAGSVLVNSLGEVFVTGSSEGAGTDRDFATIKYDQDGNEAWVARYDGPTSEGETAVGMALDETGNVYVTGWSYYADWDIGTATIKYDPDGNEVWAARYEAPGDGVLPSDVSVDSSGSVYIVGTIGHSDHYMTVKRSEYILLKYDSSGTLAWEALYDGPHIGLWDDGRDLAAAMVLDDSGDIYVTGYSVPLGSVLIKQMTTLRFTQAPPCIDSDGDGFGRIDSQECTYPERDCDDTDPGVHPSNWETGDWEMIDWEMDDWEKCHNGIDDDCDGFIDGSWVWVALNYYGTAFPVGCYCYDVDGDGYGADYGDPSYWAGCAYPGGDCNDYDPQVNPGDPEDDWEECHNGIDDDCNGWVDTEDPLCTCTDNDGDGYGTPESPLCVHPEEDCDDTDPEVNPAAEEVLRNDIDDDCDGEVDETDCFIATAAFGSEMEGRIEVLRDFRDEVLMDLPAGRALVAAYYELSPPLAEFIARHGWLRVLVRALLLPLVGMALFAA